MRRFVEKISFKRLGVSTLAAVVNSKFLYILHLLEEYHAKRKLLKKQLKLQPRARRSVTATENGASSVQNSMLAEEELIPAQTMKAIVEMANKLQDMSQLLLNQNSMLVQQIVQMQAAKAATAPAAAGTAPAAAAPAGAAGTAATAPAAAAPAAPIPAETAPSVANIKAESVQTVVNNLASGSGATLEDKIKSIINVVTEFTNISIEKVAKKAEDSFMAAILTADNKLEDYISKDGAAPAEYNSLFLKVKNQMAVALHAIMHMLKYLGRPVIVLAVIAVSGGAIVVMIMNPLLIGKLWPVVTGSVEFIGILIVEIKADWSTEEKNAVLAITAQ